MTENTYYCGLCRRDVPISTWPHPHNEREEDEPTDRPGYEELDDEEQGRIEAYLRHEGLSIDTPINLSAESLETAEPPEMYYCEHCGSWHPIAGKEYYCPLDPRSTHATS